MLSTWLVHDLAPFPSFLIFPTISLRLYNQLYKGRDTHQGVFHPSQWLPLHLFWANNSFFRSQLHLGIFPWALEIELSVLICVSAPLIALLPNSPHWMLDLPMTFSLTQPVFLKSRDDALYFLVVSWYLPFFWKCILFPVSIIRWTNEWISKHMHESIRISTLGKKLWPSLTQGRKLGLTPDTECPQNSWPCNQVDSESLRCGGIWDKSWEMLSLQFLHLFRNTKNLCYTFPVRE